MKGANVRQTYFLSTLAIPGMILHESSHVLMCFLLGVEIMEFYPVIFEKGKGFHGAVHRKVTGSLKRSMLIAFAPSIFMLPVIFELVFFANILKNSYFTLFVIFFMSSLCLEDFPSRLDLSGKVFKLSAEKIENFRWVTSAFTVFQILCFTYLLGSAFS